MSKLSILDLVRVCERRSPGSAFQDSLAMVQHAETYGFERYWVAEHHNMPGIASAATSVVIGHLAEATRRIRIGAGGIMLPHHAPLVVAEQFGTESAPDFGPAGNGILGFLAQAGGSADEPFNSEIGGLLPMELCGRTSL